MLRIFILTLCMWSLCSTAYDCNEPSYYDSNVIKKMKGESKCISNCSYWSDGTKRFMPCSVEACRDLQCKNETPYCPELQKRAEDISFIRFKRKGKKMIALKIRWSAPDFAMHSEGYPQGYHVEINDALKSYSTCYYFGQMMGYDNRKDILTNNCFLPSQSKREPLYPIHVAITSLPLKCGTPYRSRRSFEIGVTTRGNGFVDKIHCKNFSVNYRYDIDPNFGSEAFVSFCQLGSHGDCEGNVTISQRYLNVSGTLHNLTFPSTLDYNVSYRIFLNGESGDPLNFTDFSFSRCLLHDAYESGSNVVIVATLVSGFVLVITILFVYWRKCKMKGKEKDGCGSNESIPLQHIGNSYADSNDTRATTSLNSVRNEALSGVKDPTVFVLFANDSEEHVETVSAFCNYLQKGLGLHVKVSIWDTDEYEANSNYYITQNIVDADKVLLICSERTKKSLDDQNDTADPDIREFVMSTNCALSEINYKKFLVCYFSYCSKDCIPIGLAGVYHTHYKLLDNMKDLYLHIKELEEYYVNGKICMKELNGESDSNEEVHKLWDNLKWCIEQTKTATIRQTNSHQCDGSRDANIADVVVHNHPTNDMTDSSDPTEFTETHETYQDDISHRTRLLADTGNADEPYCVSPDDELLLANHTNFDTNQVEHTGIAPSENRNNAGRETDVVRQVSLRRENRIESPDAHGAIGSGYGEQVALAFEMVHSGHLRNDTSIDM